MGIRTHEYRSWCYHFARYTMSAGCKHIALYAYTLQTWYIWQNDNTKTDTHEFESPWEQLLFTVCQLRWTIGNLAYFSKYMYFLYFVYFNTHNVCPRLSRCLQIHAMYYTYPMYLMCIFWWCCVLCLSAWMGMMYFHTPSVSSHKNLVCI